MERPPGHPLINGSECCMGSPGSQHQNWVCQPFAKLLFSCCGLLTGDSPQMNNTSSRFKSESIRKEALLHRVSSRVRLNVKPLMDCGEPA